MTKIRRVGRRDVYRGRVFDLTVDRFRDDEEGREFEIEIVNHNGGAAVLPVEEDGTLVLIRQWRYPLGRVMLEFPAGKLERGEPTHECAVRELAEETGYRAREWARAGVLHNAIAYSDEAIEVWFARGLTAGERRLDDGEFLDLELVAIDELDRLCASGAVTDAKTLVGLLWLQNWHAGRWEITWQAAA